MPSKYRNIPTEVEGRIFQSKREAARYVELRMLERSGIITELRCQVRFNLDVNGVHVCNYLADFTYSGQDGRLVVEDVKGVRTATYRLKAKLMIACHALRIVEVQ